MSWPWMFYLFGFMGIFWVLAWAVLYQEARTSTEEEFIEPPKVSKLLIIYKNKTVNLTLLNRLCGLVVVLRAKTCHFRVRIICLVIVTCFFKDCFFMK